MVSRIVCLMTIVGLANGGTWGAHPPEKPREFANKEGCYINEINDVIPFGKSVSPIGMCYKVHCGVKYLHYESCGIAKNNLPNCFITETDLSRPYPQCCPGIKCEDDNYLL